MRFRGPQALKDRFEISLWKGRKKQEERKGAKEKSKRAGIQTAELDRRDQVTATKPWPGFLRKGGTEVDYQMAHLGNDEDHQGRGNCTREAANKATIPTMT